MWIGGAQVTLKCCEKTSIVAGFWTCFWSQDSHFPKASSISYNHPHQKTRQNLDKSSITSYKFIHLHSSKPFSSLHIHKNPLLRLHPSPPGSPERQRWVRQWMKPRQGPPKPHPRWIRRCSSARSINEWCEVWILWILLAIGIGGMLSGMITDGMMGEV